MMKNLNKNLNIFLVIVILLLGGCNSGKYVVQRPVLALEKSRLIFSNASDYEICIRSSRIGANLSDFLREEKIRYLNCTNVISKWTKNSIKENDKTFKASNEPKNSNQRPLASLSDTSICYNATTISGSQKVWNDRNDNFVGEAKYRNLDCGVKEIEKTVTASKPKITKPSISSAKLEKEKAKRLEEERKRKSLEQKLAALEKEKQKRIELEKKLAALQSEKKKQIKKAKQKEIGSGFYVSKFRHVVTNQHVVNQCKKITVGDSVNTQIPADLIASDKRNDLAILQTVSMEMASSDTKSFIQKLKMEIGPIVSGGLMRSEDVNGGEEILVAGFPLGNMVSDTIKVTKGIVSATKGMDNDVSQFEIDAVIRKGNSGGPIYDKRGNIVGVAVSRLNVNRADTINFGIKGSTVKQFLSVNDIPTKWSNRNKVINTQELYKIASKQTVMVVCHR